MQRVCLAFLRCCLSAWVGIAIFFVLAILDLRHSELFDRVSKLNHPKVLFPLYYGFEFPLLGTALVCALVGSWNAAVGAVRRYAVLAIVAGAFGLALLDYTVVYRNLVEFLGDPTGMVPAAEFVKYHKASRKLNEAVLALSVVSAVLALWPETSRNPKISANSPGPAPRE